MELILNDTINVAKTTVTTTIDKPNGHTFRLKLTPLSLDNCYIGHHSYVWNTFDKRNEKCYYIAQTKDTLSFLVTIKDRVNASVGDSEHDNFVQVPIKVIVLDENDVVPVFQNVSIFVFLLLLLQINLRHSQLSNVLFISSFPNTFSPSHSFF